MQMVAYTPHEESQWVLTEEGKELLKNGSYEARVFYAIPDSGIALEELNKKLDAMTLKVGSGKAFKNKWIRKDASNHITRALDAIKDDTMLELKTISETRNHPDENILKDLKKRKLIDKVKITWFSVKKGGKFALEIPKLATDLTSEMLQE
jgi:phenylalanyl-tRNA synthetase alpha chain